MGGAGLLSLVGRLVELAGTQQDVDQADQFASSQHSDLRLLRTLVHFYPYMHETHKNVIFILVGSSGTSGQRKYAINKIFSIRFIITLINEAVSQKGITLINTE